MASPVTSKRRGDSAVLRRMWRLHFWVALFTAPVLVVLSLSGLVILYTGPLDSLLNRSLVHVSEGPHTIPLDRQIAVAQQQLGPDYTFDAVTPPGSPDRSTRVDFLAPGALSYPAAESDLTQVFVDPYTGRYLGRRDALSGLVGFANNVHRMFGNDGPQVNLPSLGHLIDSEAYPDATIPVGIGNLWIELTACWILVLLASGIYLWWPRAIESAKPMFRVRWSKGGRLRWRDVHALTGVVIAVILVCYILSGLTWSRYWGENWRAFSATVTPSSEVEAASTPAQLGDYDRLGRRIAWAATGEAIPESTPPGPMAATLTFADIDLIAKSENMVPGYAIIPPSDSTDGGETIHGSYAVVNAWPQRLSEQRTLYLNQFTGETITNATAEHSGALGTATSFGIDMHMGNQFGVLTRIMATAACLGIFVMIGTGLAMWWKRRPAGKTGVPGPASPATRADTPARAKVAIAVTAVVVGVIYPVFGVSLLLVLAVEALLDARRANRSDGEATGVSVTDTIEDSDGDEVPVGALH
ncbi:PepSY domain-containing protein [Mycolicibacterium austroafricanum]|uniref:PepSY domain-containing protein n=1 Tax=Mycolicibacterium austroafricanum TaxID=39687 RepID=A0ABT8H9L5_MYCAO|nr:PepSY domain-containing protein [Mycolicibacterium austroafricanum]MDN4517443.1 PepSY domain-containing protein [Mycolicibacterium austroafricanum]PQP41019.1 PepSY domain-containing protein [Mycolicibacterium austroafricanum]QRZ07588.1 PepSY domain-containing protein [Mycolicibacterium austroafricanum]QZT69251.1 PepSY domain-containing protein [Mycolicibacterium austroafricanum]